MLSAAAHRYIRYGEIVVVGGLLAFALVTYLELSQLRRAPVALPNYEFDVSGGAEPVVRTRGTWISGGGIPGPVQTTTIECKKSTMHCTESSAAIVFLEGKGLLESKLTDFEVGQWTDKQVTAKPVTDRCTVRSLSLDLAQQRALSRVSANPDDDRCEKVPDKSYELLAGYKVKVQR